MRFSCTDTVTINTDNNNLLKELPSLPNTIIKLYCSNNLLTKLPELPESLRELYCSHNQIKEIDKFNMDLEEVDISYNKLKIIPDFIGHMWWINYKGNPAKNEPVRWFM